MDEWIKLIASGSALILVLGWLIQRSMKCLSVDKHEQICTKNQKENEKQFAEIKRMLRSNARHASRHRHKLTSNLQTVLNNVTSLQITQAKMDVQLDTVTSDVSELKRQGSRNED